MRNLHLVGITLLFLPLGCSGGQDGYRSTLVYIVAFIVTAQVGDGERCPNQLGAEHDR